MKLFVILMLLMSSLSDVYTPYNVKIFPGVKGGKEGYYIKFSSKREEFISRKSSNGMFSIIEYRIVAYKGKKFLGGDIYIDTLDEDKNNFSKLFFYPSIYDTLRIKLIVKDKLSGRTLQYNKTVIKGFKEDRYVRIFPPVFLNESGSMLFDLKGAKSLELTILNRKKTGLAYHVDLIGDTILGGKKGILDSGYNCIDINLNEKESKLPRELRVSVQDSSNLIAVFPLSVADSSERESYLTRVRELVYIAKPNEIRKLKNASESERDSLWNDFWKKRDPIPTTRKNEAEIEYYRRVKYANEHFTCYKPGWKTDRGMIYIKYGSPDDIESYPFNVDSQPYEIWYYDDLHKRFVFIDKYGLGDYQLVY